MNFFEFGAAKLFTRVSNWLEGLVRKISTRMTRPMRQRQLPVCAPPPSARQKNCKGLFHKNFAASFKPEKNFPCDYGEPNVAAPRAKSPVGGIQIFSQVDRLTGAETQWLAWWARPDLNREPKHYECSALTIELQARRRMMNRSRLHFQ